jgi:hypothetical protein
LWQAALVLAQVTVCGVLWVLQRRQKRMREQTEARLRLLLASLRAERLGQHGLSVLQTRSAAETDEARTLH